MGRLSSQRSCFKSFSSLERVRKLKAERDDGTGQAKKGVPAFFALFPIGDQAAETI